MLSDEGAVLYARVGELTPPARCRPLRRARMRAAPSENFFLVRSSNVLGRTVSQLMWLGWLVQGFPSRAQRGAGFSLVVHNPAFVEAHAVGGNEQNRR
jgi:hypothetical protein